MFGDKSTDDQANQIIERLEAAGLANIMDYKFETAKIVEVPEDHWAYRAWNWVLVMEPMVGEEPESFVGSVWTVEQCLEAPAWDIVDHISDSSIIPRKKKSEY
jgi:hypothetical protein